MAGWLARFTTSTYLKIDQQISHVKPRCIVKNQYFVSMNEILWLIKYTHIYIYLWWNRPSNAIQYFIVWCFEKNLIEKYTNSKSNETITKIVCTLIDELQRLWSVEHFALKTFSIIPRRWRFDGKSMDFFFLLLNWFLLC